METIKDIMTKKVTTFREDSPVYKIAKIMGVRDIGCVIITRNQKPVGIITERDMVKRVIAKNLDVRRTKAKQIMTSPVESLNPNANIYYTSKIMQQKGYKRYPVVKDGKLIGIISQSNLINYFTEQRRKFVIRNLSKKLRKKYI